MDKRIMHSPDLVARNIEKLAELFPTVVTETRDEDGNVTTAIDFDLLRQELSDHIVEGPQERYRLDWPGKRAAAFAANAPIAKTLRPVREESVDFDTTKNIFIEGDNLDALKLLQESYLGKVKLIYIDPPYNTGKDFIYEDDFTEKIDDYLVRSGQKSEGNVGLVVNAESTGRLHSNWLSMMYPRVKLSRSLLAEDGVFIAAIDDREHGNLRSILDEIFGAENFLANVVWQGSGKNDARFTAGGLDYMLIYARSKAVLVEKDVRFKAPKRGYDQVMEAGRQAWDDSQGDAKQATKLFKAWWKKKPDVEPGLKAYSEIDERGSVYRKDNLASPNPRENLKYEILHPVTRKPVAMHPNGWRLSREVMEARIREGRVLFGADDAATLSYKRFLWEMENQVIRPVIVQDRASASDALGKLIGEKVFGYPKDVDVLAVWVNAVLGSRKDAVVLDFFGGSGSTAHAVMALNSRDGGSRQFILVQIGEKVAPDSEAGKRGFSNIAEISRERLRRAGDEFRSSLGEMNGLDFGFRCFRVASGSLRDIWAPAEMIRQPELGSLAPSIQPDRSAEDLLFQVILDWGLELSLPIGRDEVDGREVFDVDDGALIACFAEAVTPAVVRAIAERGPLRAVFRDDAFASDAARINAEQIFRELSPGTEVRTI